MAAGGGLCGIQWQGTRVARGGGDNSSQVRAASCGEHAAAVERKTGGRRGREGGVREPRWNRSWSEVMVIHDFFYLR
jgi:hypothetical protein